MRNYIAYHKVAEWGIYKTGSKRKFSHYSGHPLSKLEKTIGQNVWVISGDRIRGQMVYKLCGVYCPTRIAKSAGGGFSIIGEGAKFDPQIELTGASWLTDLLKEQRNFRYGLNEIRGGHIIESLQLISRGAQVDFGLPEEVGPNKTLPEGARKQVIVNAYERNPVARVVCINHYGSNCYVCGFNFEAHYGEIGKGYIHIHHLKPLAAIAKQYRVDPIKDLRPVCPNCHAMIHRKDPPYTLEEMQSLIMKV